MWPEDVGSGLIVTTFVEDFEMLPLDQQRALPMEIIEEIRIREMGEILRIGKLGFNRLA